MSIDRSTVERTLERIAEALTAGDAETVAGLWEVPGLVLADEGARPIAGRPEIAAFFTAAIGEYRRQGTPSVTPRLVGYEPLTARMAAADVEWRGLDTEGRERSRETSHYLLRLGDDGIARIQVALSRADDGGRRD